MTLAAPPDATPPDATLDADPADGSDGQPVAAVEDLSKVYRKPGTTVEVSALRGIDVSIMPGEYAAIMGASGSGKSTLMNILGCLDQPTGGRYLLGGEDVSRLDDERLSEIRSERIGFVFQNFNLIQQLSVLENLEVPMFYRGIPPAVRRERALELAEKVGLGDRGGHRPWELSGGQQQRVCIARSLVNDPLIILADEPVSALDVSIQAQVVNLLQDLQAEYGMSYIFIAHDLAVVKHISDRVAVMYLGRIVELADKSTLFADPRHPYTQALMAAVPRPEPIDRRQPVLLEGDVPSPAAPPPGCTFHTRCPHVQERCRREVPALRSVAGREAACHFAETIPPLPTVSPRATASDTRRASRLALIGAA